MNVAPLQGERHGFAVPMLCMYLSPTLYSAPCISRAPPDGWILSPDKSGDSMTLWINLCVEHILARGIASMGVRRY